MVIHAFDPARRTNAQLMEAAWDLEYIQGPVLDLTYGEGAFWKHLPLVDVTSNDIDPAKGDHSQDFRATTWADSSFMTVVFDPPYRLGGTPSTPEFEERYGITEYRSPDDLEKLIRHGVVEACRLAYRYALVKVQDHVSSGDLQPLTHWVMEEAFGANFKLVDSLHVIGGRAQPSGRSQKRARHGYSTLLVFRSKKRRKGPEQWKTTAG